VQSEASNRSSFSDLSSKTLILSPSRLFYGDARILAGGF
jgi:hypothetical protein